MKKNIILFTLVVLSSTPFFLLAQNRQPVIALTQVNPMEFAWKNATIVVSPTSKIENGQIYIKDGKIVAVGKDIEIPSEATVYDAKGQWIYAGWIEPSLVASPPPKEKTEEEHETGTPQYKRSKEKATYWNDAVRAQVSVAASMTDTLPNHANLRAMGFTVANVVPSDGVCRGMGALVACGNRPLQSEMLQAETTAGFSFRKGSSQQYYPSSLMGAVALLRQAILDAYHYRESQAYKKKHSISDIVPVNTSLEALAEQLEAKSIKIFETESWQHTLLAMKIAEEFKLTFIYQTQGDEYKRIEEIAAQKPTLITSLDFPKPYDVQDGYDARSVSLEKMRAWEQAPLNPSWLAKNKIRFAFTSSKMAPEAFLTNLRKAISYGLTETAALEALTTTPAGILGIEKEAGTLEKGRWANFFLASGNIFAAESRILSVFTNGVQYTITPLMENDARGEYQFKAAGTEFLFKIKGDSIHQDAQIFQGKDTTPHTPLDFHWEKNVLSFRFMTKDSIRYLFKGFQDGNNIVGTLTNTLGENRMTTLTQTKAFQYERAKPKVAPKVRVEEISSVTFPNKAFGFPAPPETETVLVQNATVWTNSDKGILENTDVLFQNGKIADIGTSLKVPQNGRIIDGRGKHLTNGIIDEHSHIAIMQGVNEGTHSVTSEVRIADAIDSEDINIYRQLSGGVTAAQLLHGSANPIGGQSQMIKLRWGATPEEMICKEAPAFIKFALGENVKQSNAGDKMTVRYPQTRLGVEQIMQDAFQLAKDYQVASNKKDKNTLPPRRDLQLEALVEILQGKRNITCHSYVQSEITMLIRLAEKMGFKVNTFTHILEGYKIADKIKKHGAFASTFSDWWGYKVEVMEATPYNSELMRREGITVCVNSDDAEMGRRLNQEAAKGVKYGGMPEIEAWKMVTLNPAKALHLDTYLGTIEVGKQADWVLWTDNPLSVYAKVLYTFIDGKCYFDHEKDLQMRNDIAKERARLIQKMIQSSETKEDPAKGVAPLRNYHCED